MTLIARILIEDDAVPVLFADALLSCEGKWPRQVDIATGMDVNSLLPSDLERQIAGTVQKLNVLSDRVIVAWAGDTEKAKLIIEKIAKLDREDCLTTDTLCQLIDESLDKIKDELALIGVLISKDEVPDIQWFDFNGTLNYLKFGNLSYEVIVAGSGKKTFLNHLNKLLPTLDEQQDLLVLSDQISASLISTLFPYEIMTGGNLAEWWGGAFEVATFDRDSRAIRKVSDILFTFWRVIPDDKGGVFLVMVPRFIKQSYFEDVLVIQDVKAEVADGQMKSPVLHAHMVLPILKSKSDYDFKKAELGNFDHKMLCAFILPHDDVSPEDIGVRVYWDADGVDKFSISLSADSLKLSIAKEFLTTLESDVSDSLGINLRVREI